MSTIQELMDVRRKKLAALKEHFGDVYPASTNVIHSITDTLKGFRASGKKKITVAGRITAIRGHGGSVFFDVASGGHFIQCYIKRDTTGELFGVFADNIDVGDFVEVTGRAFYTKKKEKTIEVVSWKPLAKALRPLPEKWHGLQDVEERYRKRSLDLLMNKDVRERFNIRARTISNIRQYLEKDGFIEVETPVLQPIPGGTNAQPFVTHHNALDIDLYLRIAPELYLKRLVVGGYDKVFEIGRNFRNEGIDVTHNPEFTMLEAYATYIDYMALMKFVETFIEHIIKKVLKSANIMYQGNKISVKKPFRRLSFNDALKRYALLPNVDNMSFDDLALTAKQFGIKPEKYFTAGKLKDSIFNKAVRPHLVQPIFIYDYPADLLPLAKKSFECPEVVESFQLFIGGLELVKAFSELNDPAEQLNRFSEQEEGRKMGDKEAHSLDEEFIETMEYGMPPTAGFGLGIDRLSLLLADMHNLREVILFPTLKPRSM